jgi:hypothetical protein
MSMLDGAIPVHRPTSQRPKGVFRSPSVAMRNAVCMVCGWNYNVVGVHAQGCVKYSSQQRERIRLAKLPRFTEPGSTACIVIGDW